MENLPAVGTGRLYRFEDGDPRNPPHTLDERAAAVGGAANPLRWHLNNGADWLAVQLQYGRGLSSHKVGAMFSISESSVRRHADKEKWLRGLSLRDRCELARIVWLGGLARITEPSDDQLRSLRAASEWRPISKQKKAPLWRANDREGERQHITVPETSNEYACTDADSKQELREHIGKRLDALIARFDAEDAAERAAADAALDCSGAEALVADAGVGGPA